MKKFEIARKGKIRSYYCPLFSVFLTEMKVAKPLIVFSNGDDAVALFVSRSELASILKNKFKNHEVRRREKAESALKKLA